MSAPEQLTLDGMSCQGCVKHLREALEALDGVTVLDVAVGNARIVRDDATCSVSQLEEATEEAGYPIVAIEPA